MTIALFIALALAAKPPVVAKPAVASPAAPGRTAAEALATQARAMSTELLIAETRRLNEELEFEKLLPFANELSSRTAAPLEARRDAWLLLASALVILGDPVSAERPFTQLLRVEPAFSLPKWVEPKVALVFKKVQAEERELARALAQRQREAKIAAVTLEATTSDAAMGGKPLPFTVQVRDPDSSVRTVRVAWRKPGEPSFSSLALTRANDGSWHGEVPAELTQNENGLSLAYYVESADAEGPLASLGTAASPRAVSIAGGKLEKPWRAPLPRWAVFTSGALTLAAGAVTTIFAISWADAQKRYTDYTTSSLPISYELEQQLRTDGVLATQRTNVSLGILIGLAVTTVVMAVLTDWRD